MIVSDEDVIAALLKDAKRFKSKWELHTNEPTRSKPNVVFLKRTLNNVIKNNINRTRQIGKHQDEMNRALDESKKSESSEELKKSKKRSRRDSQRSKSCSKSKYRSPDRKSRSKKSSKRKRDKSRHKER